MLKLIFDYKMTVLCVLFFNIVSMIEPKYSSSCVFYGIIFSLICYDFEKSSNKGA